MESSKKGSRYLQVRSKLTMMVKYSQTSNLFKEFVGKFPNKRVPIFSIAMNQINQSSPMRTLNVKVNFHLQYSLRKGSPLAPSTHTLIIRILSRHSLTHTSSLRSESPVSEFSGVP